jgi:hypothetical protein
MQVKVDNGCMGQAVAEDSMHDANMDVVDPTEPGWIGGRAVMARWSNGNEGAFWPASLIEYGINRLTYTTQGTFQCVQGVFTQIQISFMELGRRFLIGAAVHVWPLEFLPVRRKPCFCCITHHLQLVHPLAAMHVGDGGRCQRQSSLSLVDAKGDGWDGRRG